MKIWDLLEVGLGILLEDYNQQQYVLLQRDESIQVASTKRRGKPLKTWREGIQKDMTDSGATDHMAYDNVKWSSKTHKANSR